MDLSEFHLGVVRDPLPLPLPIFPAPLRPSSPNVSVLFLFTFIYLFSKMIIGDGGSPGFTSRSLLFPGAPVPPSSESESPLPLPFPNATRVFGTTDSLQRRRRERFERERLACCGHGVLHE